MGFLFAALYDRMARRTEEAALGRWRSELLGDLSGDVLEIGAGTGLNLPHYPDDLTSLTLTEPDEHMRGRLEGKLAQSFTGRPWRVTEAGAGLLPFDDGAFDAAVSTLVLCTVPDAERALNELLRVLRPGGVLVFLEHVAAGEGSRRLRWQRRIEPLWTWLCEGCHLMRRTEGAIRAAGFEIVDPRREELPRAPGVVRSTVRGLALKPSGGTSPSSLPRRGCRRTTVDVGPGSTPPSHAG